MELGIVAKISGQVLDLLPTQVSGEVTLWVTSFKSVTGFFRKCSKIVKRRLLTRYLFPKNKT